MSAKEVIVCDGCGAEAVGPLAQGWRVFSVDKIPDGDTPMLRKGNRTMDGEPCHFCPACVVAFVKFFHELGASKP